MERKRMIGVSILIVLLILSFALPFSVQHYFRAFDYKAEYNKHKDLFLEVSGIIFELYTDNDKNDFISLEVIKKDYPQYAKTIEQFQTTSTFSNKKYEPSLYCNVIFFGHGGGPGTEVGIAIARENIDVNNIQFSEREKVSFYWIDEYAYTYTWIY